MGSAVGSYVGSELGTIDGNLVGFNDGVDVFEVAISTERQDGLAVDFLVGEQDGSVVGR